MCWTMEALLLWHPTRSYKAGLVIKINGMKIFILSGKKEIPDGRTAGKVIAHSHFKDTWKTVVATKSTTVQSAGAIVHFHRGNIHCCTEWWVREDWVWYHPQWVVWGSRTVSYFIKCFLIMTNLRQTLTLTKKYWWSGLQHNPVWETGSGGQAASALTSVRHVGFRLTASANTMSVVTWSEQRANDYPWGETQIFSFEIHWPPTGRKFSS